MSGPKSRMRLVLSDKGDAFNFRIGDVVTYVFDPKLGHHRVANGIERAGMWVRRHAASMTRWFRTRTVIDEVDLEDGSIRLVNERWSWIHWRWERR